MYCLDANRLCESNITLLLTKWFILMYCDTFEEQTSCKLNMWLLHKVSTIFHTWKVFIKLVYDDFIICMIQGESPRDYNLLSSILHSFLFMSFSLRVSHIKFLMRQYQYKNIYRISYFSPQGFLRKIPKIYNVISSPPPWGVI